MKKRIFIGMLILMFALAALLVGCGSDGNETETEEILTADVIKATILSMANDLKTVNNVKVTVQYVYQNGSNTRTLSMVGEGDDRIIRSQYSVVDMDDGETITYGSDAYFWKNGDSYIMAGDSEYNGQAGEKGYEIVSKADFERVVDAYNVYDWMPMDDFVELLTKGDCIVSGKKITQGNNVRHEFAITIDDEDRDGWDAKTEVSLVAENGKIVSGTVVEKKSYNEKNRSSISIRYGVTNIPLPSLDEYELHE